MVIMEQETYYNQDKFQELWLKIDKLHLSYLEMDESPDKIRHREKLEDCIADFLITAQHRDKFVFTETEDVLYRSAAFKKDFSGYKAATGWNALQMYAANLLTQPWRKEYRHVKTYCGFYKHQIEANLIGAETMFGMMGYKHVGNGVLVLEGPICPDRVSNVSRDCLVAYMECQILKHIWEDISPLFTISWLDVLENRVYCPGTIEQCVENIKHKFTTKQFPPVRTPRMEPYENRFATNNQPPGNYMNHHNHAPPQYCLQPPHTNGCPNNYATYGYSVPQMKPILTPNGYFYPTMPVAYPVPTGQLIELESRNGSTYDVVDEATPSRSRRSRLSSNEAEELSKNGVQENNKLETDEDWDYVYRNLERKGYTKDLGERGDLLGLSVSDKQRKQSKEPKKVKSTNLDEAMNSFSINERPMKMTEALEQLDKKVSIEKSQAQAKERRHSQGSSYENVTSNEAVKGKPQNAPITVQPKLSPKEIIYKIESPVNTELKKVKEKEKIALAASLSSSKWQCKSCTYLNDGAKEICEMCSKSRHMGQEQPMEVGGPECSKCTLVNPRTAKTCQACNSSLKNSPTYI
ncbi:unnamed protein product [Ceutorhynchus assimilis]|uniref:RanBP2-type domain-containing protein n=1 Tax=Ceutorhynchus assimilis TaxID=467358 RepID=A0A9N9MK67_9CUCU|nr:unnamed protein product [Ceutorhynchus assimilis]